jgi:hypothetical protein
VVPLPEPPTPVVVADHGCAGGANEMAPIAAAVDAVRARSSTLPVEVVHTDLPTNDFGPLFRLLQSPQGYPADRSEVYPSVVGRTLYGPLMPDRRLHLGWCAITLHWLSAMPVVVADGVYSNLVPEGPERDALRRQAARDWRTYLRGRARELVDGGELVVVAGLTGADGLSGAEGLFRLIGDQLAASVADGTLRRAEAEHIFYPTWNRTIEEWTAPLAACGFDEVDRAESAADDAATYGGTDDGERFADAYTPFVRAVTEPAFFRWLDDDRTPAEREAVTGAFYAGLHARIAAEAPAAACRWRVVTLRLRRRPRGPDDA